MGQGSSIQYAIGLLLGPFWVQPGLWAPTGQQYVQRLLTKDPSICDRVSHRIAMVTGVTIGGIGYHIAEALAIDAGMKVILAGRSLTKLRDSANKIRREADERGLPEPTLFEVECDLNSLRSVENCVKAVDKILNASFGGTLHILVNNAGAITNKYEQTKDGVEGNVGRNYLAPHYLTELLLPHLKKESDALGAPCPRVVHVSSIGHAAHSYPLDGKALLNSPASGGAPFFMCKRDGTGYVGNQFMMSVRMYGLSKLMLMSDARALAKKEPWLRVVSVHPGSILSNFYTNLGLFGYFYFYSTYPLQYTPAQGSLAALRGALDPSFNDKHSPGGRGAYLHCTGREWRPRKLKENWDELDFYDAASELCKKKMA